MATRTGCHEQTARAHRGLARATAPTDADTARRHYGQAVALYTELGLAAAEGTRAELSGLG